VYGALRSVEWLRYPAAIMSTVRKLFAVTPEQYLQAEKSADVRRELVAGQLHEMNGVSRAHNLIAVALVAELHAALRPPLRVYVSDVKVRVDDDFYYPDLVVSDEPLAGESYYLTEPVAIIEILSPTTEIRDRLEKRIAYQRLPSLLEYALVAQEGRSIEVFRRRADGWELETYGAGEIFRLQSIAFSANVDDIYGDAVRV
jgi:Uma2 family endonuclease